MAFKPFFIFLIFHIITVSTTHTQPQPYSPNDNIVLDCGSSKSNTAEDGRPWDGDINNKIFPLDHGQNKASITSNAVESSNAQVDPVPYGTARLSRSEFSYTIPVTPGPKFIRLYFYAANYQNFDRSKAFFSVKTGQYTLLNNFSTSLTADFLQQQDMMREFCVTVEESILNITFTPTSSISEAFAFINGIEVVSMPANLSYPDPQSDIGQGIKFVGQENFFPLKNGTALETAYRINIGGGVISPSGDTGMFRKWDVESNYLTEKGVSVIPVTTNASLQFTAIPAYTAPEDVYKTARSTGSAFFGKDKIMNYTLTWQFPVDSGFNYLVRLHFCEIVVNQMKVAGDRVFNISLANENALTNFDIIRDSGGTNVPFKEDFVVSMNLGDGGKKVNLSVSVKPISDGSISKYIDAILNGVEIFKLSDTFGNLAAPNPVPIHFTPPNVPPPSQKKKSKNYLIGIVAGVVSGVVVLSVIAFLIFRRGRKFKDNETSDGTTKWGPISFSTTKSTKTRGSSSLPSELCRHFSLAEIKAATNNFDNILIIGVGGFGDVYKGYIDGGTTPVAIKRLKAESSQGVHEFKTEIEMLSHLRHLHLVSLIGYCNDDREMILVYDYMARGTLRSHLYNSENPPLSWIQRLQICIGAARGLHYLHKGAKYSIIHRDVKTTNILLDEKWVAKVSDFGLSKMGPTTMSKAHVSTVVKGSIGYLDPEYYRRQQLSEKSDVYSFGVVLCEVLCGRPPIIRTVERKQMSLAEWASSSYKNGTLYQIIDPYLTGKIAPECLKKYGEIAISCMSDNGAERPSMNDVVWSLEFALQLQQNAEDNNSVGGASVGLKEEEEVAFINNSESIFTCSWEDTPGSESIEMSKISSSEQSSSTNDFTKGLSRVVFSEIGDPKGR
ncbi:hypothetical protein UlMin_014556 [Ulmus minor]